ncbi:MAG: sodium:solute symporter family protein, partial [Pseudomonadota bacterium]
IIAQLAPPVFAALFWRRATTPGVIAGLLAGGGTALTCFFYPELKPVALHEGLFGLIVHVPVLVAVSLATPAQDPTRVETYINPPPAPAEASG